MTVPSQLDIKKKEAKLQAFLKRLNEDGSPKRPMDDNLAKGLMRDAVRKKWMYCPTKLAFLLMNRIPDMDNKTRTKWLQQCNICDNFFKEPDVNVDHVEGEIQFTEWSQAQGYASGVLDVKFSDLQILCIECHKTKSRAEALGLDWRTEEGWSEALMEQRLTILCKQKASDQDKFLAENGISGYSKNAATRRNLIREVLKNDR